VFEVPKAMKIIMEYNSSHTEYLAGHNYTPSASKGMRAQLVIGMITSISTKRPYRLHCGHTEGTPVWLFPEGLSFSEYHFVEVTPMQLAKATCPILKKQSAQEWAFKIGTLCKCNDINAPNWVTISSHKGYEYVRDYLCGEHDRCDGAQILSAYFRLGTYCKWGTPFELVGSVKGVPHLSPIPGY
jgi:hypothetical protein